MNTELPADITRALFDQEGTSLQYRDYEGSDVIGLLAKVPTVSWGVVADNFGALAFYARLGAVDANARILELDAAAIARLAGDDELA